MIPRRRIPLHRRDALHWLQAPWLAPELCRQRVSAFEEAFARRIGTPHARATASGREALGLIIDTLGLGPGDELIIPAYTLGELVPLLQDKGLTLVPADIDPETFNVTAETVAARLSPRTRGVFAVHLLGAPCDIAGIASLTRARGVPLIEDCAHATGASVAGRAVGSFGQAALFSLEPTKPVSAFGGGVLTTADSPLIAEVDRVMARRRHGQWPAMRKALFKWLEEVMVRSPLYGPVARRLFAEDSAERFDAFYRRANARTRSTAGKFSAFQATVAGPQLSCLDERNEAMNSAWNALAEELPARFHPQSRDRFGEPAFYNFTALFDGDIGRLRVAALARGLDLGIRDEIMSDTARMLGRDDCPGVARVVAGAVQIPLYPGLSSRRRERLLETLHLLAGELP